MVAIGKNWTTLASATSGKFTIRWQAYYSEQDYANNQTHLYIRLLLTVGAYGSASGYGYYYGATGITAKEDKNGYFSYSAGASATDYVLNSGDSWVKHNADGTYSITGSGQLRWGWNGSSWVTVVLGTSAGTGTLPTIPRTSQPTSTATVEIGNEITLNTNRASDSFTHEVSITIGSTKAGTIANVGAFTTIPTSTYASILVANASGGKATMTFTVTTKSGSTIIGSASCSSTVTITPSAPSVSASSVEIGNAVTVNTNRIVTASARIHILYYRIGSGEWVAFNDNVDTSAPFNTWSYVSAIVGGSSSGKTTVDLACNTYLNGVYLGTKTTSVTVTITPSAPTLNKSSITVGATVTLSTNRLSTTSARTHTVVWKIGSTTLETDSSVTTSCSINTSTYSAEIMTAIGSTASSGTVTATVTTYVNGGSIGSKSVSFTANVNTSAYKPTITFGTLADTNDVVKNYHGTDQMINLMSNLSLPITFGVTATQGMALKSYKITFGTTSVSGTLSGTSGSTTFTYNGVQTNTITVTVTDARGTSASATKTFTLLGYQKPTITKQEVSRGSMTGTDAGFTLEGTAYAGTYEGSASVTNSLTISYTVTPVGGSASAGAQTYTKTFSGSGSRTWSQSSTFTEAFENDKQFDIKFTVSDAFSTITSGTLRLYNGLPVYGWGEDHFDVYGDFHIHKRSDAAERWVLPEALDAMLEYGAVKNLVSFPSETVTTNGITWTIADDGTVEADGTATADTWIYVTVHLNPGTYIISGCPSGGSYTTYEIQLDNASGTAIYANDYGEGASYTASTEMDVRVYIGVRKGTSVSDLIFKPMLRDARFASNDYVPNKPSIKVTQNQFALPSSVSIQTHANYTVLSNVDIRTLSITALDDFPETGALVGAQYLWSNGAGCVAVDTLVQNGRLTMTLYNLSSFTVTLAHIRILAFWK